MTSGDSVGNIPTESYPSWDDYSSIHENAKSQYEQGQRDKESAMLIDISRNEEAERKQAEDAFNSTPSTPIPQDEDAANDHQADRDSPTTDAIQYVGDEYEWTEKEIRTLVLAVQHEVGKTPDYFPYCNDFDKMQKCMARVIVNRIGQSGFGDTLEEVLNQKNQFTGLLDDIAHYWDLPNSNQFDPEDRRTINNVKSVINGTDGISHNLYFERCSLPGQSSIVEAWEYCRSLYASDSLELEWYEETADNRFLMFISNPNGAY